MQLQNLTAQISCLCHLYKKELQVTLKLKKKKQQQLKEMGQLYSLIKEALESFSTIPNAKILMLGLDGAGKTTLLYKLKINETAMTVPTIGFNVETIQPTKSVSFTVWDVGGQQVLRPLWRHYFQNCDGLIFVVDSSDYNRFAETREELEWILGTCSLHSLSLSLCHSSQAETQCWFCSSNNNIHTHITSFHANSSEMHS